MYRFCIKRILDIIISFCAIVILSPLLLVVSVWLYFANKGSGIFFSPLRPGKNGKLFKFMKFKSMTDEKDENGKLLPDDKRLTKIGKFVRSTSIDELPQLFNVLRGDMSIIGPRPLSASYLPYYSEEEMHRHDVRPGITGWAQVNGRTSLSWPERFGYDLEYVRSVSFIMDVKILFLTVYKVFKRENVGVEQSGHTGFYIYRESEWAANGKHDLIEKARKESLPYRLFK